MKHTARADDKLFIHSMGKRLQVTALFDNDAEANVFMERNKDHAVIACFGPFVFLAKKHDRGIPVLDLKYDIADNGNCRVYYRANNRLYCWQQDDYRNNGFVLYSCSEDGEPSCRVRPECIGETEKPKGDESIERELIAFIDAPKA